MNVSRKKKKKKTAKRRETPSRRCKFGKPEFYPLIDAATQCKATQAYRRHVEADRCPNLFERRLKGLRPPSPVMISVVKDIPASLSVPIRTATQFPSAWHRFLCGVSVIGLRSNRTLKSKPTPNFRTLHYYRKVSTYIRVNTVPPSFQCCARRGKSHSRTSRHSGKVLTSGTFT